MFPGSGKTLEDTFAMFFHNTNAGVLNQKLYPCASLFLTATTTLPSSGVFSTAFLTRPMISFSRGSGGICIGGVGSTSMITSRWRCAKSGLIFSIVYCAKCSRSMFSATASRQPNISSIRFLTLSTTGPSPASSATKISSSSAH